MAGLERRWAQEREQHERQVQPWRFLVARGPRRSATRVPTRLRYWSYAPPRIWVVLVAAVVVAGYVLYVVLSETATLGRQVVQLIALVVFVLVLSVCRITVSNHGISFDIAGIRRVSCYGFVALSAVLDVAVGEVPDDWPKARSAASWFFGARRVTLLYLLDGDRAAKSLWVRDPDRFAEAVLGRPRSRSRQ